MDRATRRHNEQQNFIGAGSVPGQLVLEDISHQGWHCSFDWYREQGQACPYAYTVGLNRSFRHPELTVFGLQPDLSRQVLGRAVEAIAQNRPPALVTLHHDLMDEASCVFVLASLAENDRRLAVCRWYYGGGEFPLRQIVWSNAEGLFPWQPTAPVAFRAAQPLLGDVKGRRKPAYRRMSSPSGAAVMSSVAPRESLDIMSKLRNYFTAKVANGG